MGRPKKYTSRTLEKAVERYFDSISREIEMTEKVDTGQCDTFGHKIYEDKPVCNKRGEPVKITEYLVPPTVGGLCEALGIHRSTWAEYCNPDQHPEFSDTTTRARGRLREYLEQQLLIRSGRDVKGVIFSLQNNYGYADREEADLASGKSDDPITKSLKEEIQNGLL